MAVPRRRAAHRPNVQSVSILAHLLALLEEREQNTTALLREMDMRYRERFEAQTKAVDAAFLAQQAGTQAALIAADRAVQTALTAAEKAVNKAEAAAEKRFESVNEFRGQLTDQAATFMPRAEAEQRMSQMGEAISKLEVALSRGAGHGVGTSSTQSMFFVLGGLGLTLLGVIVTIVIALRQSN